MQYAQQVLGDKDTYMYARSYEFQYPGNLQLFLLHGTTAFFKSCVTLGINCPTPKLSQH